MAKTQQEDLKSRAERRRIEVNKVAEHLNAIEIPLTATMYSEGMKYSLRNIAFWKALKKADEKFIELINVNTD